MEDDFFSDLVPIKPSNGSKAAPPRSSSAYTDDNVLSALPDPKPGPGTPSNSSDPTLSGPLLPMGEPRHKKEAREMESSMQAMLESTFKRFAGGLQNVLEDVNRRLEALENQTEQIRSTLSEQHSVEGLREGAGKERFNSLEKSLRDIQRGVQLIRDKQELLEAQAELAKLSPPSSSTAAAEPAAAAPAMPPPVATKVTAPEAPKPAEAPKEAPAQVAAPAPTPPPPPPPPAPAPLPSAPVHQETAFAVQQPSGTPSYAAPQPAPPQLAPAAPPLPQQPAQMAQQPQAPPPPAPQAPPPPPPPPPQQQQQYAAPPPQQMPPPPPPPPQQQQYSAAPNTAQHQFPQAPPPPPPPMPQYSGAQYSAPFSEHPPMPQYSQAPMPGYPALARPSFPAPQQPPPPQQQMGGSYGGGYGAPPPPAPQGRPGGQAGGTPTTRSVPLEKVIDDVANMGFSRHEVHAVISDLMDNGQSVDLNVVLDRLMNGPRR